MILVDGAGFRYTLVSMPTPDQQLFVVLDSETTGLDPAKGEEMIEIAAQKVQGREVIGEYVALLKATRPIPPEAERVHGISQAMLDAEGRPAKDVMPELVEFIGDAIIVAHNTPFDMGFINAHLDRLGLPKLTNKTLDTLEIARRTLLLASYKLSNVAAYLKVPQPSAHRALIDVITCREVFFKLVERAQGKK